MFTFVYLFILSRNSLQRNKARRAPF